MKLTWVWEIEQRLVMPLRAGDTKTGGTTQAGGRASGLGKIDAK
jgi:hypothetical protein